MLTPRTTQPNRRVGHARPGFSTSTHARSLVQAWDATAHKLPGTAIAVALRSAARIQEQAASRRTDLVISGPISPSVPVRLTSSVVIEVIRAARNSLLIVSFAAYGVAEVIAELAAAAARGVRVDLVLEGSVGDGGTLRGPAGASAAFSQLTDSATFWHWPAHRRAAAAKSRSALHAKIIAADTAIALISSANLTDRALSTNLEVGVVIKDPMVTQRLVRHFEALMGEGAGVLERTSPGR
ncbi:DISARM system phospholipase D-like protein DrmC [Actinoplanes sp. NPDC020271]|uniref:DISARM system phospholipase D-like protein DrmC n=1 Tax=Actinoplanes sp. NPDC020271 TaxID=3363896 RepID=UPI0037A624D5